MPDINKVIGNPNIEAQFVRNGEDMDHLLDLGTWNAMIACELAKGEGIDLTDEHWKVIHFLRSYYQRCGPFPSGRAAQSVIEEEFSSQGGRKYLYHLFPRGPVVQALTIAGLPLPAYAKDQSFGSTM